jgi:hypothetical protein
MSNKSEEPCALAVVASVAGRRRRVRVVGLASAIVDDRGLAAIAVVAR